jgi:carbamoyl-phosphate synthase large subunit
MEVIYQNLIMNKKSITILLTDVSHPVTPRVVEILKKNKKFSINVIGVDSSNQNFGSLWVDKFYSVSKPENSKYVKEILNICIKEKVNVIVPWTNSETLAISKNLSDFQKKNIKIIGNEYILTRTLVDKGLFYKSLEKSNVPIPKYKLVSNIDELERAIDELGYPKKRVVVKPRNLSGGRGLFVLSPKSNIDTRNINYNIPKNALLEIIRSSDKIQKLNYIVMEYLEGEDYSVDTLCNKGKAIFVIQRKRLSDSGGVSIVGETTSDSKIQNIVVDIINYFKIDFNCNIQLRYRSGVLGLPYVYDINPRISGTIIANKFVGIDLLTLGIYQALGIPLSKNQTRKYKNIKMIRYWSEKYQKISSKLFSAR